MSDDTLNRYRNDPADDPEAAATIDELIARGKVDLDAIREIAGAPDRDERLPEIIEHAGGLVETIGDLKPHIDTKGEREQIAEHLLVKSGLSGDFAKAVVLVVKGLVKLWRKRRDEGGGSAAAASRIPRLER